MTQSGRLAMLLGVLSLAALAAGAAAGSHITGIWANEGGDKVTQDELRVTKGVENQTGTVHNKTWDGHTITLAGAGNETVSFNMVLENGTQDPASRVSVSFDTLLGPDGATIQTTQQATGDGVFNWVGRPIELFYVRYVEIKGMSAFGWFHGSEAQLPKRFQAASQLWSDRPDHNKFYPDALVPMELVPTFAIAGGQNQSVWADIFIPKSAKPGTYGGLITIQESGVTTHAVPVALTVAPFQLPDRPALKVFTELDTAEIQGRYVGPGYINWSTPGGQKVRDVTNVYEKLFHRNGIEVIDGESEHPAAMGIHPFFTSRYSGELFTAANGYDGRGVGLGWTFYCLGPYGTWGQNIWDEETMWQYADGLGSWFQSNFPALDTFIYLKDEPNSGDFSTVDTWAKWLGENPGPGRRIKSMATASVGSADVFMPHLQIAANGTWMGECPPNNWSCDNVAYTNKAVAELRAKPNTELFQYAVSHPGSGTANTEDDGIAMRTLPWIQSKMGIDRWFYWYANLNTTSMDFYQSACTWECGNRQDSLWGQQSGGAYTNGNGLLVYPGTDINFPQDSYGVNGPIASMRLKEWRRGLQDGDYLALANAIDPVATAGIVQQTIPQVLWEVKDMGWPTGDPSWYNGTVSWSSNPDDWESARAQLAAIITNYCSGSVRTRVGDACTAAPAPVPTPAPASSPSAPVDPVGPAVGPLSTPAPAVSTRTVTSTEGLVFVAMSPCRVVDTRLTDGSLGQPFLAAHQPRTFPLASGACQVPSTAQAYSLNLTVVPHQPLSYITIWPSGSAQPLVSNLNSYDGRVKSNFAIVPTGSNGSIDAFATGDTDVIMDLNGYFVPAAEDATGLQFYPVTPCRVVETRTVPEEVGGPFLSGGVERSFPMQGSRCGIPADAKAYALNYTAVPHRGLSWMTAWPTGQPEPLASTLNAPTGAITANSSITLAGTDGAISVFAHDESDLVIDIAGYFAPPGAGGLSFFPVTPCRAFDSRTSGAGAVNGAVSVAISSAGCGIPATARVLATNATVVPDGRLDYLTIWPSGQNRPLASTLNASDGQVMSNLALVQLTAGSVSAYASDRTQLIFDVTGYFQ